MRQSPRQKREAAKRRAAVAAAATQASEASASSSEKASSNADSEQLPVLTADEAPAALSAMKKAVLKMVQLGGHKLVPAEVVTPVEDDVMAEKVAAAVMAGAREAVEFFRPSCFSREVFTQQMQHTVGGNMFTCLRETSRTPHRYTKGVTLMVNVNSARSGGLRAVDESKLEPVNPARRNSSIVCEGDIVNLADPMLKAQQGKDRELLATAIRRAVSIVQQMYTMRHDDDVWEKIKRVMRQPGVSCKLYCPERRVPVVNHRVAKLLSWCELAVPKKHCWPAWVQELTDLVTWLNDRAAERGECLLWESFSLAPFLLYEAKLVAAASVQDRRWLGYAVMEKVISESVRKFYNRSQWLGEENDETPFTTWEVQ